MSFVVAASAVVSAGIGVYKAVQGKKAADAAADEAAKARIEMDKHKKAFEALDTSNPYLNMENTMEDLTVNQQQAEFENQKAAQSRANIMGQMRGAAGSSGIAGLAQSLANAGSLQAQQASASIGAQEAANQKLAAQEAGNIQGLERKGEVMSRNMEFGKVDSLLGLAAGDVSNAQGMEAMGRQQMWAGVGDAASGAAAFAGQAAGWGGSGDNKTAEVVDTGSAAIAGNNPPVVPPPVVPPPVYNDPNDPSYGMSDKRLKTGITEIGLSPNGLKIYSFKYIDQSLGKGTWQGVMSDEVPPFAVTKNKDGYDMVDYSKLDVEFKQL